MIVKLLTGKVYDGGIWQAGEFLSVPDEVGEKWIADGEAVNRVEISDEQLAVSDSDPSTAAGTPPLRTENRRKSGA